MKSCKRGHLKTPENVTTRGDCKECARERSARSYAENREKVIARSRAHLAANPERAAANNAWWRAVNANWVEAYGRQYRTDLRAGAVQAYTCGACACCGETTAEFLTVGRVVSRLGREPQGPSGGQPLFRWLREQGYPPGFETLCTSCNESRRLHEGSCPHRGPVKEPTGAKQRNTCKLKAEALAGYGGECGCCGETEPTFLCFSRACAHGHLARSGANLHRWLRQEGWPACYRVLCFNCAYVRFGPGRSVCPHQRLS
ncbi:hypothetical protein ABZT17_25230 [Streptomyces sp. NPDC005648]|uniref:hypothetical protein n=1 Tax=Streptomyces sp. NPDC005648 TaxID=3157044 RepID=UPI0033B65A84